MRTKFQLWAENKKNELEEKSIKTEYLKHKTLMRAVFQTLLQALVMNLKIV
ncbi:hypothetical protein PAENIP36_50300 [Paenibacillus sp. P36]